MSQTVVAGHALKFTLAADTFTDPNRETLTLSATSSGNPLPSWLTFDAATGTFSGTAPTNVVPGAATLVTVTATDTDNLSTGEMFAISVTPPTPPNLVAAITPPPLYSGQAVSFSVAKDFVDPNGETLTFSAKQISGAALPSWLAFNTATGAFSGTTPSGLSGETIQVTATNTEGGSTSTFFNLTATPDMVTLNTIAAPPTVTDGKQFSFSLAGSFMDQSGAAMTYTASLASGAALPSWLKFNASTVTFSGTAPAGTNQPIPVKLTATALGGASASEDFLIHAIPLALPVFTAADATATVWGGHLFQTPLGAFVDPNGSALTYKAVLASGQALPSWLKLNASTGVLSGTAPTAAQTMSVILTATDAGGASASATVTVTDKGLDTPVTKAVSTQVWTPGGKVSFAVPAGTFTDPNGEALTYKASLTSGQALPAGLTFNAATDTFGGTAPITAESLAFKITATNTDGGSASMTFITTVANAPTVAAATASQVLVDGKTFSIPLASAFKDPQHAAMTLTANEISGANASSWLHFNATTDILSGILPTTGSGDLGVRVTATNSFGLATSETFGISYAPTAAAAAHGVFSNTTVASEMIALHS